MRLFFVFDIPIYNKIIYMKKIIITEEQLNLLSTLERNKHIANYIKSFGVKGKLPSFDGNLKDYYESSLEEAYKWGCESTDYIKKDGFPFFKHNFIVDVVARFLFNKRRLIYVERSIDIDTSEGLENLHYKSVGECWTWKRGNSQSYCANFSLLKNSIVNVVICGYVHPQSVDWLETIYLNSYNMKNEREIRMNDDAFVEVAYLKIQGEKFPIGGAFLLNASSDKYNKNRENW